MGLSVGEQGRCSKVDHPLAYGWVGFPPLEMHTMIDSNGGGVGNAASSGINASPAPPPPPTPTQPLGPGGALQGNGPPVWVARPWARLGPSAGPAATLAGVALPRPTGVCCSLPGRGGGVYDLCVLFGFCEWVNGLGAGSLCRDIRNL